ncbi:MAG: NAD(P)H-hydrate dehydratase [Elusimicrobia bacterium]|nr:NAD(P)H-hydrate dehydratase [Elusimicrobiota bacterium]
MRPEAMTLGLPEKDGKFSFKALSKISEFIKLRKVTSIVIGPGIGKTSDTARLVKAILLSVNLPLILDADGLNAIPSKSSILRNSKAKIIATPHPGELSRLIGVTVKKINQSRINAAKEFSKKNNLICVLKGHKTVVSDGNKIFLNTTGNPGMATGGSGDVLSGMISALISQVKEPKLLNAALSGVFLHGLAGDYASKMKTQIGLLAQDIAENIPVALKKVTT